MNGSFCSCAVKVSSLLKEAKGPRLQLTTFPTRSSTSTEVVASYFLSRLPWGVFDISFGSTRLSVSTLEIESDPWLAKYWLTQSAVVAEPDAQKDLKWMKPEFYDTGESADQTIRRNRTKDLDNSTQHRRSYVSLVAC